MMSRTRVPNKVQWGLDDALDAIITAQRAYGIIKGIVIARNDTRLLRALVELGEALGKIEVKVADARRGEYRDEGGIKLLERTHRNGKF